MSNLQLDTAGGNTAFRPLEEIEVTAKWQFDEAPEAIEVRLVWYTRGKGDVDVSIVQTTRFELPASYETRQCRFTLPAAPYSFSGKIVSLIWAVELVALPSQDSHRLDIVVGPRAEEVDLYASAEV